MVDTRQRARIRPSTSQHFTYCNTCQREVGAVRDWNQRDTTRVHWRVSIHPDPAKGTGGRAARCGGSRVDVDQRLVFAR